MTVEAAYSKKQLEKRFLRDFVAQSSQDVVGNDALWEAVEIVNGGERSTRETARQDQCRPSLLRSQGRCRARCHAAPASASRRSSTNSATSDDVPDMEDVGGVRAILLNASPTLWSPAFAVGRNGTYDEFASTSAAVTQSRRRRLSRIPSAS